MKTKKSVGKCKKYGGGPEPERFLDVGVLDFFDGTLILGCSFFFDFGFGDGALNNALTGLITNLKLQTFSCNKIKKHYFEFG